MRDGLSSCSHTGDGCSRSEMIPAATGRFGDTHLLAPLDDAVRDSLARILSLSGLVHRAIGSMIELDCVQRAESSPIATLKELLPVTLQQRIKGVFFDNSASRTAESLISILLHAELLPALFDALDVEWARAVLLEDRLFSVYHPIVNATDGGLFAYEALIRARHPFDGEVVGAKQLIYACERLNLHNALDQCARITALKDASKLNLHGAKLFMNFLPSSIYEPEVSFRSTIEAASQYGISMERLVFEVIETEQIENMETLRTVVEYYREHGAGIALDDISSGFASLQYLADLMPDYAKIDRNLVTSAVENDSCRHTLDSLCGLARKLNVKVIAEGIETTRQMDICLEAGVDYMQGFLFALPAAPPNPIYLPEYFSQSKAA